MRCIVRINCFFIYVAIILMQITIFANSTDVPKWGNRQVIIEECMTIGKESFEDERYSFGNLNDITVSSAGNVIVVDTKTLRVLKFSKDGTFLHYIGKGRGDGPGEFRVPWIVTTDPKENVYVADHGSSSVLMFNDHGVFVDSFKTRNAPTSIAVDQKGHVFLGYWQSRSEGVYIYKYNLKGDLLAKFCKPNDPKLAYQVEMSGYSGSLCVLSDGNIVYSFHYPYETRIYSPDGILLNQLSRQNKLYAPPAKDSKHNAIISQGGCIAVKAADDGKIVNYIFTKNQQNNGKKYDYCFDFFDKTGLWLASVPADSFNSASTRTFAIDNEGYFYFIFHDPFPHIKKYKLKFVNNN